MTPPSPPPPAAATLVLPRPLFLAPQVPGDVVLSVNGISGLSNFQVVEMLRKGQGVFNLVVISGRQVQAALTAVR